MSKNITHSFVIIALVALAASAGTLAYFTDSETSTGNTVTAGTMDLVLVDGGSPTFTEWYMQNMKPGDDSGGGSLKIYNVGTVEAASMDITFHVFETEDGGPLSDTLPTAVGMSKLLRVVGMSYSDVITPTPTPAPIPEKMVTALGDPVAGSGILDVNDNGYIDLDDLNGRTITVSAPPMVPSTDNANSHKELSLTVIFVDDAGYPLNAEKNNMYQGDKTELQVQFDLNQI